MAMLQEQLRSAVGANVLSAIEGGFVLSLQGWTGGTGERALATAKDRIADNLRKRYAEANYFGHFRRPIFEERHEDWC